MENKDGILKKSIIRAKDSLINFCQLQNINFECFEFLFDNEITPIWLDCCSNDAASEYLPYTNTILIDKDYFDDMVNHIQEFPDDESIVISNIATQIVHEMLHANRNAILEGSINEFNIKREMQREYQRFYQEYNNDPVEKYNAILEKLLEDQKMARFEYIPLRVSVDEDGEVVVVAYNQKTKELYSIKNPWIDIMEDTLYDVGMKINNDKGLHSQIIYYDADGSSLPYYQLACFSYSPTESLVDRSKTKTEEELKKKEYEILKLIGNANGLEESLTHVLASVIVMTRRDSKLDLPKVLNKLYNNEEEDHYKAVVSLISVLGEELINWFLLSSHKEVYTDRLKEEFNDDYEQLLIDFNNLYNYSTMGVEEVQHINSVLQKKKQLINN